MLLRAHRPGGEKHLALPVHQGDAVGGHRAADPLQLLLIRKPPAFPVDLEAELRPRQDVVIVNAAAQVQLLPAALDHPRDLPEVIIHLFDVDVLAKLKGGEKHNSRDQHKDPERQEGQLLPILIPQHPFDFFHKIHEVSPFKHMK